LENVLEQNDIRQNEKDKRHTVVKYSDCIPASVAQLSETHWHSGHRPGRSIGGAGVQFPGTAGRFRVRISGAHDL